MCTAYTSSQGGHTLVPLSGSHPRPGHGYKLPGHASNLERNGCRKNNLGQSPCIVTTQAASFCTAYYREGTLEIRLKMIAWNYLKTNFVLDLT
eukprot:1849537-Amphidinium_carterae.1